MASATGSRDERRTRLERLLALNPAQPALGAAQDRISAIVIARNAAHFVAEALESIVRSSRVPDEIILIDGASTDATREIAAGFPGVRVIVQQSQGIAGAYNEGIAAATNELVAFLSSDDRWMPDKLRRQSLLMAEQPELDLVVCHVQHVLEPGCATPPGFRRALLDAPVPGFIMECLLVRRRVFDRIGMMDPAIAVSNDTDWYARARDHGVRMHLLDESLVWKRVHDRNSSLTAPDINQQLLQALRRSVERKRATATGAVS